MKRVEKTKCWALLVESLLFYRGGDEVMVINPFFFVQADFFFFARCFAEMISPAAVAVAQQPVSRQTSRVMGEGVVFGGDSEKWRREESSSRGYGRGKAAEKAGQLSLFAAPISFCCFRFLFVCVISHKQQT